MSSKDDVDELHFDDDDDQGFETFGSAPSTPQKKEQSPDYKLDQEDYPNKSWTSNKGLRDQQAIDPDDITSKWDKFKI